MNQAADPGHTSSQHTGTLFSVPSFLHGVAGGVTVLALMAGWMMLRVDDTLTRLQDKQPSKTAVIERVDVVPPSPIATHTPVIGSPSTDENAPFPGEGTSPTTAEASTPTTPGGLPIAPFQGLYETRPEGQLPIANMQTGVTPFEAYKKPATLIPGRPRIAILFINAGLSAKATDALITTLPGDISLSVSPYAAKPGVWMNKIRTGGHEVWLTLPLQNDTYPNPDPGPETILSNVSLEQNQARLMQIIASGAGYAGLISLRDHNITANNMNVEPLVRQIFARGMAFVDGRTDRPFFAQHVAEENSYPYAQADLWLGEDLSPEKIGLQLKEIEHHAQSNGQAIVFVYPGQTAINAIAQWAPALGDRGLQLVPLSALVKQ